MKSYVVLTCLKVEAQKMCLLRCILVASFFNTWYILINKAVKCGLISMTKLHSQNNYQWLVIELEWHFANLNLVFFIFYFPDDFDEEIEVMLIKSVYCTQN